jgi:hypothetical protein
MSEIAVAPTLKPCEICGLSHPEIFVNKKVWDTYDEPAMAAFKQAAFDHYRATGYPQYVLTEAQKERTLRMLVKRDYSGLLKDGIIGQNMYALGLAWSYHPHHISVECGSMRTVEKTWNDDALLKAVIEKRLKYGAYMSNSGIRKSVRSFTGTQAVSNFRPTAAAAIYDHLLPEGGTTWDMSMGWGGRLLGAVASKKVRKYIGCDPASKTFAGLRQMEADIRRIVPERGLETDLHMLGSEMMHVKLAPNTVDLCFTSPPYFDCEKYADEETQSYKKFPSSLAWLEGFMGATLDNCEYCLKPDGFLAVNIADVGTYSGMEDQFLRFANRKDWKYVETLKLALSRMMGTRKKQTDTHKYEPIYVFKRK